MLDTMKTTGLVLNGMGKLIRSEKRSPILMGCIDMHGNVWEWTQDIRHSDYDGAPNDGSVWESGGGAVRVNRGGSSAGTTMPGTAVRRSATTSTRATATTTSAFGFSRRRSHFPLTRCTPQPHSRRCPSQAGAKNPR
ncbi:MAG: SUMF1/EgtB/PvdO family nonheme iron enzyme [archaeon]|nr:SUMF1/EgtB/PvdO family nonheme iron enzyme [archaeon]